MSTVTVSPKFQVVIPKRVRQAMAIAPGMEMEVIQYGKNIIFVPMRPIKDMEGAFPGIDTTIIREKDRL